MFWQQELSYVEGKQNFQRGQINRINSEDYKNVLANVNQVWCPSCPSASVSISCPVPLFWSARVVYINIIKNWCCLFGDSLHVTGLVLDNISMCQDSVLIQCLSKKNDGFKYPVCITRSKRETWLWIVGPLLGLRLQDTKNLERDAGHHAKF